MLFSHARAFCVLCLPLQMIASVQLGSCSSCHFESWCAGLQCIGWLFAWEIKQWRFCTGETAFS